MKKLIFVLGLAQVVILVLSACGQRFTAPTDPGMAKAASVADTTCDAPACYREKFPLPPPPPGMAQ